MTSLPATFLIAAAAALVSSILLTRYVRDHARRIGAFDPVDERKVHRERIPRVGGVGVVLSIAVTVAILSLPWISAPLEWSRPLLALLGGALGMHLVGLADDVRTMPAPLKLLGQTVVAGAAASLGLAWTSVAVPLWGSVVVEPWLGWLIAVVWLVGITNAFNLIDGLDGLAAGVALFAFAALALVALINGFVGIALLAVVFSGATWGFFRYNAHPATIFLGDSGSLALGFLLAGTGMLAARQPDGAVAALIPLAALAVPVTDTAVAIVRRFLRRKQIFSPDSDHIHHRLLARGLPPARVVHLLYWACAAGAFAALVLALNADRFLIFTLFAVIAMIVFVHSLRFHEFQELARLVQRGTNPRAVIGRNVRFREAGARLAALVRSSEVQAVLEQTFRDDLLPRAELRLRRWFVERRFSIVDGVPRYDDDVTVWSYSRNGEVSPYAWEVSIPLCGEDERRIGTLVVWEDAGPVGNSVSHLQVIAGPLCSALEQKLRQLGWEEEARRDDDELPREIHLA